MGTQSTYDRNDRTGWSTGLLRRVALLVAVISLEYTLAQLIPHPHWGIYQLRGVPIVFGLAVLFFGRRQLRELRLRVQPLQRSLLALHAVSFLSFAALEVLFARNSTLGAVVPLWLAPVLLLLSLASLTLALIPLRTIRTLVARLGIAWLYAGVCTGLILTLREIVRRAWDTPNSAFGLALQAAAFHHTELLLRLFYPNVIADPVAHLLGSGHFYVQVSGTCSGIEGQTLILVLILGWLVYARKELRIGRALLLIPVAMAMMWCLNILRLAGFVFIGNAGYPEVASTGFHTEAGWIVFNLVSLGFLLVAQHVAWFRKPPPTPVLQSQQTAERNLAVIYLGPFLAVLAVSLLTQAASKGFESLYPLRPVVAGLALYRLRREYSQVDWRFGAIGPLAGLVVAALWIGEHLWSTAGVHPQDTTGASLAMLSPGARLVWIAARVVAAVVTVPIVEELAFRGYVARRVVDEDVEAVPFSRLNLLAIAVSSASFGVLHGQMWPAGIVAGVVFALVVRRSGRLGEAVAAHATANLALAVYVLVRGDYTFW